MSKKRIFISFAIEDKWARDYLVGQSKNEKSPFEFIDMSVKEPWEEKWKTQCRTKIKGCDGMIVLISNNTKKADGQIWEGKCAKEEKIPLRAVYINEDRPKLPPELGGITLVKWTWSNIDNFIKSLG